VILRPRSEVDSMEIRGHSVEQLPITNLLTRKGMGNTVNDGSIVLPNGLACSNSRLPNSMPREIHSETTSSLVKWSILPSIFH
jgi:hypothetical protein